MNKYINQIINEDCLDILKGLPNKCIDLVLTDPPYGIEEITGKEVNHGRGKLKNRTFNKDEKKFNGWDKKPNKTYFEELFRVSKNQIIWGYNYFEFPPCRCFIYWDKMQPFPNFSSGELAWTNFNLPSKQYVFDNRYIGKIHPTQKPVELFKWCINLFSQENDLVLDCFSGSGTTAIASHDLKRRFICIEKDEGYYKKSVERLENFKKQLSLF